MVVECCANRVYSGKCKHTVVHFQSKPNKISQIKTRSTGVHSPAASECIQIEAKPEACIPAVPPRRRGIPAGIVVQIEVEATNQVW